LRDIIWKSMPKRTVDTSSHGAFEGNESD
jgi:hypothetical protein